MKLHLAMIAPAAVLAIAGCAPRTPAAISAISDSSLTVVQNSTTDPATIEPEARRGCGLYGKVPVRISSNCPTGYCSAMTTYLYACSQTGDLRKDASVQQTPAPPQPAPPVTAQPEPPVTTEPAPVETTP